MLCVLLNTHSVYISIPFAECSLLCGKYYVWQVFFMVSILYDKYSLWQVFCMTRQVFCMVSIPYGKYSLWQVFCMAEWRVGDNAWVASGFTEVMAAGFRRD